jgi:hypothetical protein
MGVRFMTRRTRGLSSAVVILCTVTLAGCGTSVPGPPEEVGDDYPAGGIPTAVMWPSDWLDGIVGEPNGIGGSIVGLRLEYVQDHWVWRVRSADPGRDLFGEAVTEPERGLESLLDATTLAVVDEHHVTLSDAELAPVDVSYYDAAQLSGETYPSPRLIELQREMGNGRPVWDITTYDTGTGVQSTVRVDAG